MPCAAELDESRDRADAGLVSILVGLVVAGLGMFFVLKRYIAANPQQPVSDAAREAGRKWEREIAERERKKEAGEEDE